MSDERGGRGRGGKSGDKAKGEARPRGGFFRRRRVCKFCADKIDYINYSSTPTVGGLSVTGHRCGRTWRRLNRGEQGERCRTRVALERRNDEDLTSAALLSRTEQCVSNRQVVRLK